MSSSVMTFFSRMRWPVIALGAALTLGNFQASAHDGWHDGHGPNWYWGDHHPHGGGGFDLPTAAAFAVIAGVTYAIVDGNYYRHDGNRYVHTQPPVPPSQTTVVVQADNSGNNNASGLAPGTVLSQLPRHSKRVSVNGREYFVSHHTWLMKLQGNQGFVVVKPQV